MLPVPAAQLQLAGMSHAVLPAAGGFAQSGQLGGPAAKGRFAG